jgi:hypothetical protein
MFACYNSGMQRKPPSQPLYERRDAPRVALEGRYSVGLDPCDGRDPIPCPLLDFSITGVRLELPEDTALPTDVQIRIGNVSHTARIVWRKGRIAGGAVVDEHHSIY